jgi:hypothetical protein
MFMGVVGIVLQCTFVAFWFLALAMLVAPPYGQALLGTVWVVLLALGIRWMRGPVPARALAIPFLAAGAWFVVLKVGEGLLGWEA